MSRAVLWMASACVVLCAAHAAAQESGGCEVRIGAVVASNSGRGLDPQLAAFKRQFSSLFSYTSYRLIAEQSKSVEWGRRAAFDLPGGRFLLVIPRGLRDGRVSLKILLIDGSRPIVETKLALRDRGMLLVGGPRHQEGVLIIQIGARSTM